MVHSCSWFCILSLVVLTPSRVKGLMHCFLTLMNVVAGFAFFHMLCARNVVAEFAFFHMLGTRTNLESDSFLTNCRVEGYPNNLAATIGVPFIFPLVVDVCFLFFFHVFPFFIFHYLMTFLVSSSFSVHSGVS